MPRQGKFCQMLRGLCWLGPDLVLVLLRASAHTKLRKTNKPPFFSALTIVSASTIHLFFPSSYPPFRQLSRAILSTALSVFQMEMMLVLLGLAFSRPVVAFPSLKPCEGFGEVACAGDPSNAWVNSNLTGPSLPPAGTTIIHRVCVHEIEFLVAV